MSSWSPTKTANGWFPHLSPSGRRIIYGFWETHVADLGTGEERAVTLPGRRLDPLGWLNEETFIAVTEGADAAVYAVDFATLTLTNLNVPGFAGVSFGSAENGAWGIFLQDGHHPFCLKNGVPFHPEIDQYGCYVSGEQLLTSDKASNYDILHFTGENLTRRLPADNKYRVNAHGDVVTGYYGVLKCYPWGQGYVDASATPWKKEEPGCTLRIGDDLWIWNAADEFETGIIMGRRLGEKDPIVLRDFPSVNTDAVWTGTEFVVAGNSDKGRLQVRRVSMDAPRTKLSMTDAIVAINRPLWFGFYEFAGPTDCPVNCRLPVEAAMTVRDVDGRSLYHYVAGTPDGDVDAIDRAVAAAGRDLPILAYVPRQASAIRLPNAVVGVECYRRAGESVEAFEAYIRQTVARCPRAVLIAQCYTSNANNHVDLRSIPPVIARVARDMTNVEGILVFSGSGRATGFQEHPEVQADWRYVAATIQTPSIVIPPEVPTMLTQDQMDAIREFVSQRPVPQAPDSEIVNGEASAKWINDSLRYGWTRHLAEYMRFKFGEDWGTKGTSPEFPSKEAIAKRRADGSIDVWDMLEGAMTGRPKLRINAQADHHVPGYFIAVTPVDHVGAFIESPIKRAPLKSRKLFSSFDFPEHRDPRWLAFAHSLGKPTMRWIFWSEFRHEDDGGIIPTFAQALDNLRAALEVARASGDTVALTLHCDTAVRGDTKEDLRRRTPVLNALMVEYLDVIERARLFNEGGHSVEAAFIVEREFCLELDAMIDPRIPLAWFANHGGDPVTAASAGGSYIVWHFPRHLSPEENAKTALEAQIKYGKPVEDAEPIGAGKNEPGKRISDADWFRRQAEADKVLDGGSCFHFTAGLWAEVDMLDEVQREAARLWAGVEAPVVEGPVTPEEIAQVVAGLFFEDISTLLKLPGTGTPGTEPSRRSAIHGWTRDTVIFLEGEYQRIFSRGLDLEGAGAWVLHAIRGKSHAWITTKLEEAYARGDR